MERISQAGRRDEEIMLRIYEGKKVLLKMRKILSSRHLSKNERKATKTYMCGRYFSCDQKNTTNIKKIENMLTALELWCYRRLLKRYRGQKDH